jgi:hypothetical protein
MAERRSCPILANSQSEIEIENYGKKKNSKPRPTKQ